MYSDSIVRNYKNHDCPKIIPGVFGQSSNPWCFLISMPGIFWELSYWQYLAASGFSATVWSECLILIRYLTDWDRNFPLMRAFLWKVPHRNIWCNRGLVQEQVYEYFYSTFPGIAATRVTLFWYKILYINNMKFFYFPKLHIMQLSWTI